MDFKKLLGEDYKEGMTLEELQTKLSEKKFTITDSATSKEAEAKLAKLEAEKVALKTSFDKASKEVSDYKGKWKQTLSEAEKAALETKNTNAKDAERAENLEKEISAMKRTMTVATYTAKNLGMGYDAETAEKLAVATVDGDMETVFTLQSEQIEKVKADTIAESKKQSPNPKGGGSGGKGGETDEFAERMKKYK